MKRKRKKKNRSDNTKYKYQQKCYERCRKIWRISTFKQNARKGEKKKKRNFEIKNIRQKENIEKYYNYTSNVNTMKYYKIVTRNTIPSSK